MTPRDPRLLLLTRFSLHGEKTERGAVGCFLGSGEKVELEVWSAKQDRVAPTCSRRGGSTAYRKVCLQQATEAVQAS